MLRDWICKCTNDIWQQNSDPKLPATLSPKRPTTGLQQSVHKGQDLVSGCQLLLVSEPTTESYKCSQIQHITFAPLSVSLPPASSVNNLQWEVTWSPLTLLFSAKLSTPIPVFDSVTNANDSGWCQVNNFTLLSFWQSDFYKTIKCHLVRKHYLCYNISKTPVPFEKYYLKWVKRQDLKDSDLRTLPRYILYIPLNKSTYICYQLIVRHWEVYWVFQQR